VTEARRQQPEFKDALVRLQNKLRAQLLIGVATRQRTGDVSVEQIAEGMGWNAARLRGKLVGPLGLSLEDAADIAEAVGIELVLGVPPLLESRVGPLVSPWLSHPVNATGTTAGQADNNRSVEITQIA
jgi:hypothetical protein